MIDVMDRLAFAWLTILAAWSLRWGILIGLLSVGFLLKAPRQTAIRHGLCLLVLGSGILLPFAPRWAVIGIPSWEPSSQKPEPTARPGLPSSSSAAVQVMETTTSPQNGSSPALRPTVTPSLPKVKAKSPQSVPSIGRWSTLVLTLFWGVIAVALLARWVGGYLIVARLKRSGSVVGEPSLQLLEECRAALRLSRPVSLASHSAMTSPVTLGGRHPLVLVPPDWETWPFAHRRACLLHELAHVAHYDDWTKLLQELVRIPLFFHPLVHWLLKRLDRERELLCDEVAVALGTDPISYARLLVDQARRPNRLLFHQTSRRPGWLPFLDRHTLAVRVERLIEEDLADTITIPQRPPAVMLGALIFAVGLGLGGLGIRAVASASQEKDKPAEHPPSLKAAAPQHDRWIKGRILDPEGQPVADAIVVSGTPYAEDLSLQVLKTDQDGRFRRPISGGANSYYDFAAYKEDLAPAFMSLSVTKEENEKSVELRLPRPAPFSGKLVDIEGQPVANARVSIPVMATIHQSDTTISTGVHRVSPDIIEASPLQHLFETTTDRDGEFSFESMPVGYWLKFRVTDPKRGEMLIQAEDPEQGLAGRDLSAMGFVTSPPDELARLVASPAATVVGHVSSKFPDIKLSGLHISPQRSNTQGILASRDIGLPRIKTDAQGRFVLTGLSPGTVNILVDGPGVGQTWTFRAIKDVQLTAGVTSEIAIELIRGIEVEGKVVDHVTGAPISGVDVAFHGPSYPATSSAMRPARTDQHGLFRFRTPPGKLDIAMSGAKSRFVMRLERESSQTVTIPDGASKFTGLVLKVDAGITLHGHVVDEQNRPVPHVTLVGVCKGDDYEFPKDVTPAGVSDDRGKFRLSGKNRSAPPGHPATILVRLADQREFRVSVTPKDDGTITVKLPPNATTSPAP